MKIKFTVTKNNLPSFISRQKCYQYKIILKQEKIAVVELAEAKGMAKALKIKNQSKWI